MSSEKHAVFRYADDVVETETNDLQQLIESVRHVRFDGVITVCDYYIETVCEVAKAYNVPCPFSANVKTARQKHLMRQAVYVYKRQDWRDCTGGYLCPGRNRGV